MAICNMIYVCMCVYIYRYTELPRVFRAPTHVPQKSSNKLKVCHILSPHRAHPHPHFTLSRVSPTLSPLPSLSPPSTHT